MTTLRNIIIFLIITTLCSCYNSSENKPETIQKDSVIIETAGISNKPDSTSTFTDEEETDSITTLKFNEFSVSINSLIIDDMEKKMSQIQKDTVEIYTEPGETIENQLITI
ncbi:hypothetical protein [Flavobacterium sp. H122]|uniref:hypothetical protein n=1 Tax=Flavobacterium sp. H122 TaxID=2529860 RepID=UPI001B7D894A|nr:hypothetical protein [Flavobacterium sp. H122]